MDFYFDNDIKVLTYNTSNAINKQQIIDFFTHLGKDESYPRNLKTLIDARECIFEFKIKDLKDLLQELTITLKNYASVKEAIVVTKPYETVIATLISEGLKDQKYEFKVFSTKSGAMNWLMN